ncbi:MAG: TRAP transporter large permease subunit [Rhodospirillales bacterium]|nr:TRAP transporter large permease subunit [Rhodospirillales bacterium]
MPWYEILPAAMLICMAFFIFTGFPVALVLGGLGLAFGLVGIAVGEFRLVHFNALPLRIYAGSVENIILVAIPMFIFMGTMLEKSGIADDLLYTLQVLTRRLPGGLAISVTLLGTILAATTGIIGASVVLLTLMALPEMLRRGYSPELATGTIASSGTLGILIPPSIMLVLMADQLSVPVGVLFVAALFPGLLLAALYVIYIMSKGSLQPHLAPPMVRDQEESSGQLAGMLFLTFIPPVFLIVLVLGSIFAGWATPTEASGIGAIGATLLAALKRRLNFSVLKDVCYRAAVTNAMIFGIFVGATCFSLVFKRLGGDFLIEELINSLGIGPWGILGMIMVVVFLLGFFLDWIEITLIVLPIFAPIIEALDFGGHVANPTMMLPWFAILLAVNLQTSFLTPPFGFALFYMKGAARSVKIQQIYRGIIPFVALQLLGLGLCVFFPEIVTWLPEAVLD